MLELRPILSALSRHRVAAMLITLEIALACAVLCNAFFLIAGRVALMRIDSGVDESSLALVKLRGCSDCDRADLNGRILARLRAIPGMRSATVLNTVPFGARQGDSGITLKPGDDGRDGVVAVPHFYTVGPGSAEALGLSLAAGRRFRPEDFQATDAWMPNDSQVWVSAALASHLWPDGDALGKEFWLDTFHFRVVGVLSHLARPNPGGRGADTAEWSVVVPMAESTMAGTYLLRADPLDLDRVLAQAREAVVAAAPETVLDQDESRTVDDLRHRYFRQDRVMAAMMIGVIVALLLVTALGIVGLASFWVQQRTKQIGIRRALGATRGQILRYFQTENLLLVTLGIVIGMPLAYAINQVLMGQYELARLPLHYLPVGAGLLWLLGQAAVLGPALRAARVPPAVATRNV